MSHFVYLPPEGSHEGLWLDFDQVVKVYDPDRFGETSYDLRNGKGGTLGPKQAEVLRAVLSESYERRLFEILLSAQDIEFGSTAQAINACRTAAIQAARVKFS